MESGSEQAAAVAQGDSTPAQLRAGRSSGSGRSQRGGGSEWREAGDARSRLKAARLAAKEDAVKAAGG